MNKSDKFRELLAEEQEQRRISENERERGQNG